MKIAPFRNERSSCCGTAMCSRRATAASCTQTSRCSTVFCGEAVAATGVLLLPGAVYDESDHLRVGYGRASMPDVLARLESRLETRS